MKNKLDFIVIGAAKSATTTLHELIKDHPQLSVPKAKEAPYFSDEKVYKRSFDWYLNANFSHASPDTLWGTVTPQYMIGQGGVTPDMVAERIKKDVPDTKIIALLRHPIERAFSHYRMLYKSGHEIRSFEQAIEDILSGNTKLKNYDDPDSNYVFGSEYGKILKSFYDRFPKDKILILTTDQLKQNPEQTLEELFQFLEIDSKYRPEEVNQQSRKGGGRPRVKLLTPGFLYKIPMVKKLWQNFTPQPIRKRIEYTINLWNTVPDDTKLDKTSDTYSKLVKHFSKDIKLLNRLTNKEIYWQDWRKKA